MDRSRLITRLVQPLLLAIVVAACVRGSPASRAAGEPAPQLLTAATGTHDLLATCGGHDFPLAALDAPRTDPVGPEFDALHQVIAAHANELEGYLAGASWRLVDASDDRLVFLAESTNGLLYMALRRQAGLWTFANAGDCDPHTVIADGGGPAQWWLDPRRPPPTADSTVLEILVLEQACASGNYAVGRILPPIVQYDADAITITIGVRGVGGTCQWNPSTPAMLDLAEAVGNRELLDGFHIPPAPARPPEATIAASPVIAPSAVR